MPMMMNVGLTKKVGEPNYGSRGASVNFEVELEANLVREPDQLRDKVRYLFGLAQEAIEDELNGNSQHQTNGQGSNGQNGNGSQRQTNRRPATQSQCRAIRAIADRQHTDLVGLLRGRFHTDQVEDLSLTDASSLIDELKGSDNGAGASR